MPESGFTRPDLQLVSNESPALMRRKAHRWAESIVTTSWAQIPFEVASTADRRSRLRPDRHDGFREPDHGPRGRDRPHTRLGDHRDDLPGWQTPRTICANDGSTICQSAVYVNFEFWPSSNGQSADIRFGRFAADAINELV